MSLKGKGFFIWKIINSEKGDPKTIARTAKDAQLTHVILKIADGAFPYNVNRQTNEDYVGPVVEALLKCWHRSMGMALCLWRLSNQ